MKNFILYFILFLMWLSFTYYVILDRGFGRAIFDSFGGIIVIFGYLYLFGFIKPKKI